MPPAIGPDINDLIYHYYGGTPSIDDAVYQALLLAYANNVNAYLVILSFAGLPSAANGTVLTADGAGHATWQTGGGAGTGTFTTVKNEGSTLSAAAVSEDFVGAGVHATNVGTAITVTIPGSVSGTLGARPAAAAANSGMFYFATDVQLGYISDGATWTTTTWSEPNAVAMAIALG